MTNDMAVPTARPPVTRPVPPGRLDWLTHEIADWRADGLVGDAEAAAILGRYRATRRFSLARLLLGLGAAFVGVGVIWLVAANLDTLPPLTRFGVVAALWLANLVGAELLARRRAHGGAIPSPVVGAVRVLAALAFGAVVFQAAQSLQVPAYQPSLVGLWAGGALLHAYAVSATGPLVVGLATGTGWVLWQSVWDTPSGLEVVLVMTAVAVLAMSVAVLHDRVLPEFGGAWRESGAALALAGLFAAALPSVTPEDFSWSPTLVVLLVLAAAAAVAGVLLGTGRARLEPPAALAALAVAVLLVVWESGADTEAVTAADWGHAAVSVAAYVVVAAGAAVLGILRDSWRLTALALGAVVVFTTFQSFAVFARIIEGAWLFVVLGLVFLGTGYLFDRARRELAATLEGDAR